MRILVMVIFFSLHLFSAMILADNEVNTESGSPAATQTEPEVDRYTAPDEIARNKEIKELKCTICATRCLIVKDAGQSTCRPGPEADLCNRKAEQFADACLNQCKECQ